MIAHILDGREKLITATEKVLQPLPNKEFRFASPFVLLHHMGPEHVPAGSISRIHPHPHRGFSPVSFIVEGQFHHKDTMGTDQVLNSGDVQWMFAGKGVLHSEGPSAYHQQHGGTTEMVQLWINVPSAAKWDSPQYQYAHMDTMPRVFEEQGIDIKLVSGELDGKQGPIDISRTPIISAIGTVAAGKHIHIPVDAAYWNLIYVIKGMIKMYGTTDIATHQLVILDESTTAIDIEATADCMILVLSGERIDEPVAAKDNFVMSTMEEADQAIEDYKNGKFGSLDY